MKDIIIDEEFRFLLPTLDEKAFRDLEENLLKYGARDSLVLWNDILIDGYNRYRICIHHNIPFNTVNMEFDSREEVLIWIIDNQISRRNLTPIQLSHFRGLHYNAEKKIQGTNKLRSQNVNNGQNDHFNSTGSTANRLAEQYKVSPKTIIRDSKLSEGLTNIGEVSPDVKRKILDGDVRVGKNRLEALASASREEVEDLVSEIETGTFVRKTPRSSSQAVIDVIDTNIDRITSIVRTDNNDSITPELRQLNDIVNSFTTDFNNMFQKLNSDDSTPLKIIVRSCINKLEEFYGSL
jgi:hypothetical protein